MISNVCTRKLFSYSSLDFKWIQIYLNTGRNLFANHFSASRQKPKNQEDLSFVKYIFYINCKVLSYTYIAFKLQLFCLVFFLFDPQKQRYYKTIFHVPTYICNSIAQFCKTICVWVGVGGCG